MLISMKDPFASARVATANSVLKSAELANQNIQRGGSQEERINLSGDLKHAQLEQAEAARNLAALEKLQQNGAASAGEVTAAQQRLQNAEATLQTVQQRDNSRFSPGDKVSVAARVADAQASLDSAKLQVDNANISSTMAGTVYGIQVVNYDFVPMGAELLDVADLRQVQVRAYFDEPEIGQLRAGQAVKITWDGRPDRVWHGHIKQAPVAAMVLGSRSVGECTITVDDATGDLLPNTNVMVTVTIQQHHNVMTIPREALHTDGPNRFVYRVVDGRLIRTPVEVGIVTLVRAEIVHGLSERDTVALNSTDNHELTEGAEVKVVE
jgi:HlyD family secretion protein